MIVTAVIPARDETEGIARLSSVVADDQSSDGAAGAARDDGRIGASDLACDRSRLTVLRIKSDLQRWRGRGGNWKGRYPASISKMGGE